MYYQKSTYEELKRLHNDTISYLELYSILRNSHFYGLDADYQNEKAYIVIHTIEPFQKSMIHVNLEAESLDDLLNYLEVRR